MKLKFYSIVTNNIEKQYKTQMKIESQLKKELNLN